MDFIRDHSRPAIGAFGPSDTFIAGRDTPPGSIGWHVDCSANPLDLRPAVDTILRAIDEKLPSASPEHPLVVLFGEAHDTPAQRYLLPFTAHRFAAQGHRFSIAIEQDHNSWSVLMNAAGFGIRIPDALHQRPGHLHDPNGLATISAAIAHINPLYAPSSFHDILARHYRLASHSRGKIKLLFNDAACISEESSHASILNLNDPLTAWVAQSSYPSQSMEHLNFPSRSAEGIAVRNRIMAEIALNHACRNNIPIIFQMTGLVHVFGDVFWNFSFTDSLYNRLTRSGAKVLPIYIRRELYSPVIETTAVLPHSVVINGLSKRQFEADDSGYAGYNHAPEDAFIKSLFLESGQGKTKIENPKPALRQIWWDAASLYHSAGILARHYGSNAATRVINSFDFS